MPRLLPLLLSLVSLFPMILPANDLRPRPNVIVILTDDQGYGDMSCHGNPWLKTPHLDRLKTEGISLDDYHVDPVCTPTRAALMTGLHSVRSGAWAVTKGRQLLKPDLVTMGDLFSASGYRTGMFGKWHLGDTYPYAPRYRGFDYVVRHMAGGADEIGNPAGNDYFDDIYYRNGVAEKFTGYCTDIWFDETIKFIHASKVEKPFFIYLPLNAMHSPHRVEEKYSGRFVAQGIHPEKRSMFYGMIENFDYNLGRLLQSLKESGKDDNTMIIFMGDNGTAQGAKGYGKSQDGFNAGMRGQKSSVYEGGHRVACFVRWPAGLPKGKIVKNLTCHRDWMPTLIEICQLNAPEDITFDGMSIAPLLTGKASTWPKRTFFLDRQNSKLVKPTLTKKGGIQGPQFAVLTEKWRFVNGQLYDLAKDPGQLHNVAKNHPTVVKELYAEYEAWFADVAQQDDPYTRFNIGDTNSRDTLITARDWHPTIGNVIWEQSQLEKDDLFINGYWAIKVKSAGRYLVTLSRFPEDNRKPISGKKAHLKIGDLEFTREIDPADETVVFEMVLPAGPTLLETSLTDAATSNVRGAYFIRFEKR